MKITNYLKKIILGSSILIMCSIFNTSVYAEGCIDGPDGEICDGEDGYITGGVAAVGSTMFQQDSDRPCVQFVTNTYETEGTTVEETSYEYGETTSESFTYSGEGNAEASDDESTPEVAPTPIVVITGNGSPATTPVYQPITIEFDEIAAPLFNISENVKPGVTDSPVVPSPVGDYLGNANPDEDACEYIRYITQIANYRDCYTNDNEETGRRSATQAELTNGSCSDGSLVGSDCVSYGRVEHCTDADYDYSFMYYPQYESNSGRYDYQNNDNISLVSSGNFLTEDQIKGRIRLGSGHYIKDGALEIKYSYSYGQLDEKACYDQIIRRTTVRALEEKGYKTGASSFTIKYTNPARLGATSSFEITGRFNGFENDAISLRTTNMKYLYMVKTDANNNLVSIVYLPNRYSLYDLTASGSNGTDVAGVLGWRLQPKAENQHMGRKMEHAIGLHNGTGTAMVIGDGSRGFPTSTVPNIMVCNHAGLDPENGVSRYSNYEDSQESTSINDGKIRNYKTKKVQGATNLMWNAYAVKISGAAGTSSVGGTSRPVEIVRNVYTKFFAIGNWITPSKENFGVYNVYLGSYHDETYKIYRGIIHGYELEIDWPSGEAEKLFSEGNGGTGTGIPIFTVDATYKINGEEFAGNRTPLYMGNPKIYVALAGYYGVGDTVLDTIESSVGSRSVPLNGSVDVGRTNYSKTYFTINNVFDAQESGWKAKYPYGTFYDLAPSDLDSTYNVIKKHLSFTENFTPDGQIDKAYGERLDENGIPTGVEDRVEKYETWKILFGNMAVENKFVSTMNPNLDIFYNDTMENGYGDVADIDYQTGKYVLRRTFKNNVEKRYVVEENATRATSRWKKKYTNQYTIPGERISYTLMICWTGHCFDCDDITVLCPCEYEASTDDDACCVDGHYPDGQPCPGNDNEDQCTNCLPTPSITPIPECYDEARNLMVECCWDANGNQIPCPSTTPIPTGSPSNLTTPYSVTYDATLKE